MPVPKQLDSVPWYIYNQVINLGRTHAIIIVGDRSLGSCTSARKMEYSSCTHPLEVKHDWILPNTRTSVLGRKLNATDWNIAATAMELEIN